MATATVRHSEDIEYAQLPENDRLQATGKKSRRLWPFLAAFSVLLVVGFIVVSREDAGKESLENQRQETSRQVGSPEVVRPISRGKSAGVSEKAVILGYGVSPYPWTNAMLAWQVTSYHFQPERNWMNDIAGPLYYKGWYHLFYQYNPDSAVWGNITWGHTVSKDLIHWLYLDLAMVRDQWYDINGVWTGSATLLPTGEIIMLYTGSTNESVQVQNLAIPADPSDPLLKDWVKYSGNPVLTPPQEILPKDFRDPTTAWLGSDGLWRLIIGSKINKTGISLVYKTSDFVNYKLVEGVLHAVPGTGMWECVDFYPVSLTENVGLDTSVNGPGVKHVLKASLDDNKHDYYAIGVYDEATETWLPDDPVNDVGIGLRYDYGKFYASKTFYDQVKQRRILWGWIGETDSEQADIQKGWASLQTIPRVVTYDTKSGTNLVQWPIEEVESLRTSNVSLDNIKVDPGSVVHVDINGAQLDVNAVFEVSKEAIKNTEADVLYNCSTSGGAAGRGVLGPFGLLVLAEESLSEQTAVYFYIAKGVDGNLQTFFCHDETRSSKATDLVERVYGSTVPVLSGEKLSVRILVDHSIVESFAQGGRTCITSRVYPTRAIYGPRLFLFNNASTSVTVTSLNIWQMTSALIHPFEQSS
ncbi:hypothetical protein AMTR_s00011p00252750 [Amborella trichopoda]|uniref:Beta-fructofuranosidase n=1 Tax=Amborella trichopoda TaxID=13333 RepID=W1NHU3_AMBTC|nr:hypothetical protein AMTR_s00011p00252750 [Amborella trichopoda]